MKSLVTNLLICCFCVSTLNAALTGYLKIPDIPGESKASNHEEEIDILSIDWNISRPLTDEGSGRTRGSPEFSDLVVSGLVDKSTPKLLEASASGRAFDEVVISFRKDSGEAHLDYLKITLTNVQIASYDLSVNSTSDVPAATIGLTYEALRVAYTEFDESGTSKGDTEATWNIQEGGP